MIELKPCPFCGFEKIFVYDDCRVACANCFATITRSSSIEAVIEAWNRRAADVE